MQAARGLNSVRTDISAREEGRAVGSTPTGNVRQNWTMGSAGRYWPVAKARRGCP